MVSVIVLSWNSKEEVLACVQSLLAVKHHIPLEIVVIDNASQDGSAAALDTIDGIRVIKNNDNLGYAGGNNQGYQLTTSEYVLLLNQDTLVNTAAIERSLQWLKSHPNYGAATVRLLNDDGTTQYYMHRRFPHWYDIPLALFYKRCPWLLLPTTKRYLYLDQTFQSDFDIEQAAGAFLLVRRSAIQQLGQLFDQQHFPLYYNDVDLCYRLHQARWKIRCLGSVAIQHHKGTSVRKLPKWDNLRIYLKALYHYFVTRSAGTK